MNRSALLLILAGVALAGAGAFVLMRGEGTEPPSTGGKALERPGGPPAAAAPRGGQEADAPGSPAAPVAALPLPAELREPRAPAEKGTATLSGKVVDGATRKPIARARLSIHGANEAFDLVAASDEAGAFRFEDVPASRGAWLRARADGYAPRWVQPLDIGPGEALDAGEIALAAGTPLSGRIVDPLKRPIARAQVRVFSTRAWDVTTEWNPSEMFQEFFEDRRAVDSAFTDEAGRFRFPAVSAGDYYVEGKAPGRQARTSETFTVASGAPPKEIEIQLQAGSVLEGVVRNESGQAVAQATIAAQHMDDAMRFGSAALRRVSDENGKFRFDDLGAGNLNLLIRARGYGIRQMSASTDRKEPLEIVLAAGARVRGRVFDQATGAPIAGASVFADSEGSSYAETTTDAEGRYDLGGAPTGEATLMVLAKGYSQQRTADASERGGLHLSGLAAGVDLVQDVPMFGGASVEGKVIDAETGEAIAGARVRALVRSVYWLMQTSAEGISAADGSFRLAPVGAGSVTLRAEKTGFVVEPAAPMFVVDDKPSQDPNSFELSAGQRLEGQVVRLTRGLQIQGVVKAPDGSPVGAATVRVVRNGAGDFFMFAMNGSEASLPTTDAEGRFRLEAVPRVKVSIFAAHPAHPAGGGIELDLTLGPPPGPVTITMIEGATLFGEVIGVDGQPARGLRLGYDAAADPQAPATRELILGSGYAAVADEQGRFRFDGLPAGSGHLRLGDAGFSFVDGPSAEEENRGVLDPADAALTLAPGEKRELRLRLQPTLTIRGVVLDAEGRPAPGVAVQADAEGDARGHAYSMTGDDGSFTLRGLARGRYRLVASDWQENAEGEGTQPSATIERVVEAGAANVRLRFEAPKK